MDNEMALEYDTTIAETENPADEKPDPYIPVNIDVEKDCPLWNSSCTGDRSEALSQFFHNDTVQLKYDPCFVDTIDLPCNASAYSPASASQRSMIKSWMRQLACTSAFQEYSAKATTDTMLTQGLDRYCCGSCGIEGPNVDVYYWPSPNAETSCLSIIGTSVNPILEGAATYCDSVASTCKTYWGYTLVSPLFKIGFSNMCLYRPTDFNAYNHYVTTMIYTSVNGISLKIPWSDPWGSRPSSTLTRVPAYDSYWQNYGLQLSSASQKNPYRHHSSQLVARAQPIPIRPRADVSASYGLANQNRSFSENIVTQDGQTFTSPSVYVAFYNLSATDRCGHLGRTNVVSSTLLAFRPGELSTYAEPLKSVINLGGNVESSSSYNFEDLPCPPMSVMKRQWYKPEPGEPYRPAIAFPSRVLDIDPLWKTCNAGLLFIGLDPPKTLESASAMVTSDTTSKGMSSATVGPSPAPTHAQPASQTTTQLIPIPVTSTSAHSPAESASKVWTGIDDADTNVKSLQTSNDGSPILEGSVRDTDTPTKTQAGIPLTNSKTQLEGTQSSWEDHEQSGASAAASTETMNLDTSQFNPLAEFLDQPASKLGHDPPPFVSSTNPAESASQTTDGVHFPAPVTMAGTRKSIISSNVHLQSNVATELPLDTSGTETKDPTTTDPGITLGNFKTAVVDDGEAWLVQTASTTGLYSQSATLLTDQAPDGAVQASNVMFPLSSMRLPSMGQTDDGFDLGASPATSKPDVGQSNFYPALASEADKTVPGSPSVLWTSTLQPFPHASQASISSLGTAGASSTSISPVARTQSTDLDGPISTTALSSSNHVASPSENSVSTGTAPETEQPFSVSSEISKEISVTASLSSPFHDQSSVSMLFKSGSSSLPNEESIPISTNISGVYIPVTTSAITGIITNAGTKLSTGTGSKSATSPASNDSAAERPSTKLVLTMSLLFCMCAILSIAV